MPYFGALSTIRINLMTTRTNRNQPNTYTITLWTIVTNVRYVLMGLIVGVILLSIVAITALTVLLYTGTLSVEHVTYITGDSYMVIRMHGNEFASYQLTQNWLVQIAQSFVDMLNATITINW